MNDQRIEILAPVLLAGLYNASLFMHRDTYQTLNGVRFEATNGKLTLVSTDRCQLFCQELESGHEGDVEFTFFLSSEDVKVLLAAHKTFKGVLTLTVSGQGAVTVSGASVTTHRFYESNFPDGWRSIVPSEADTVETPVVAFDAKVLAKLCKLKSDGLTILRFELTGQNKPAVVRVPNGPTVVTMPVRSTGG